jgi:NADPH:quinone reductase-like Zn-dependent oxidoreductase
MKAIAQTRYGSPDVLKLTEVPQPIPQGNQLLVRVHAAAVHAGDWHLMRAEPWLIRFIFGGLFRPKYPVLGCDVAGEVTAVGPAVTQFRPGDQVFGDLSESGFGAFAEYACAPETAFAPKPRNLSFEQAATVPVSGLTALQALRDCGQIQPGQRVLIHGASGGVGSFVVQLAKAFGAEVTGVCSQAKLAGVLANGADRGMDYGELQQVLTGFLASSPAVGIANPSPTELGYDLILDAAADRPAVDWLPALTPEGIYVMIGGSTLLLFQAMLLGAWFSRGSDRQIKCLVQKPNQADLLVLQELLEAGKVIPRIDRTYSLRQVPDAIRALEQRQVQGKIAIRID